jgi:hypothetical protein
VLLAPLRVERVVVDRVWLLLHIDGLRRYNSRLCRYNGRLNVLHLRLSRYVCHMLYRVRLLWHNVLRLLSGDNVLRLRLRLSGDDVLRLLWLSCDDGGGHRRGEGHRHNRGGDRDGHGYGHGDGHRDWDGDGDRVGLRGRCWGPGVMCDVDVHLLALGEELLVILFVGGSKGSRHCGSHEESTSCQLDMNLKRHCTACLSLGGLTA